VGLAEIDPPGSAWGRQIGRRLALHPLLANPRHDGLDVVLDVLDQSRPLLVALGVQVDVIRIRRGCAVVRALPIRTTRAAVACQISRGLLETVPATARGIRGTVIETTCRARGAEACLFTLLWDATLGVMALYRPYARHGPWAAQMGGDSTFVLDPELVPHQPAPAAGTPLGGPPGPPEPPGPPGPSGERAERDGPPSGPAIVVDHPPLDHDPGGDQSTVITPDPADGSVPPQDWLPPTGRDPEGRGGI
jgi:hypothetical protein